MEAKDWKRIRTDYPAVTGCTYLNTASSGAISKGTADAMKAFAEDQLYHATGHRSSWIDKIDTARLHTARLINAEVAEVGFAPDVSLAMSLTAQALSHKKKVAILKDEFPSVALPWISHGFDLIWIARAEDHSFDLADFEAAIAAGAEIIVVSWVHYNSGITTDLATLGSMCRASEILLVVDGTQGLGLLPMDVNKWSIDLLVGSTFKWLTGGYGTCIVYVANPLRRLLNIKAKGWNSLVDFGEDPVRQDNWKTGALSFEPGHLKYPNLLAYAQAIGEIEALGIRPIYERVVALRAALIRHLEALGMEPIAPQSSRLTSGIITYRADSALHKHLLQHQIMTTYRDGYLRVSVHFYNDLEDVDRLAEAISGYSRINQDQQWV